MYNEFMNDGTRVWMMYACLMNLWMTVHVYEWCIYACLINLWMTLHVYECCMYVYMYNGFMNDCTCAWMLYECMNDEFMNDATCGWMPVCKDIWWIYVWGYILMNACMMNLWMMIHVYEGLCFYCIIIHFMAMMNRGAKVVQNEM